MSKTQHTPTPWTASDSRWRNCIVAPNACPGALSLSRVLEYQYADAADVAFIVRAANNHTALMLALDGLINWAECNGDGTEQLPIFQEAVATLQAAKES